MRRFFLAGLLTSEVIITGEDAHHISHVLRMKPTDKIMVVATDGQVGIAEITGFTEYEVTAVLCETIVEHNEPPVRISLAQGLPKSDKMDYIIQKAVELGVSRLYPIAAERSVVKYDKNKQAARQARWQKIAVEAAKQCKRSSVPPVEPIQNLEEFFFTLDPATAVLMLYEGPSETGIKEFLRDCQAEDYLVLIGPEGGFSTAEVQLCQQHHVKTVTMGPRILRTETASLAALSLILYEKGDLGGC
ncbi:16S rRNA (uracil(1498)-N(3))-methyltransferase [bacterium BFN5]|nr:16S rRNA (uracil(1498)-N(3))-methyltransferase [bacterium BFN5]